MPFSSNKKSDHHIIMWFKSCPIFDRHTNTGESELTFSLFSKSCSSGFSCLRSHHCFDSFQKTVRQSIVSKINNFKGSVFLQRISNNISSLFSYFIAEHSQFDQSSVCFKGTRQCMNSILRNFILVQIERSKSVVGLQSFTQSRTSFFSNFTFIQRERSERRIFFQGFSQSSCSSPSDFVTIQRERFKSTIFFQSVSNKNCPFRSDMV
mmetsp:Transcript_20053/g.27619  ORF Transcript_20053/g.27619 Transcript_20053/m.27619 type:complete len:208 (+) Transcript_20053:1683-2306(+)